MDAHNVDLAVNLVDFVKNGAVGNKKFQVWWSLFSALSLSLSLLFLEKSVFAAERAQGAGRGLDGQ